jgi:uncharacterized membrane protein
MAESEAEHRRGVEDRAVNADIEAMRRQFSEARLGQVFALVISVTSFAAGVVVVYLTRNATAGLVFGAAGLTTLVGAFIRGRAEKKETTAPEAQPLSRKKRKR